MDRTAWEAQLERCYDHVLRALAAVGGSLPAAEDAVQEALVDALRPGVVERMERADGWLYVAGLRHLRRARWRLRLEQALHPGTRSVPPPGVERVVAGELLGRLTPRQREIVVARYYLGWSYAEIARLHGITTGAATATVSQALARLRTILAKGEGEAWTNAR